MKVYQKAQLARDERGYFRWFGGKRFRYGRDESQARIANARLEALWQRASAEDEQWTEPTTILAHAICKGQQECSIPPNPAMTGGESYVHWVDRLALAYGDLIRVVPEQPHAYAQGQAEIQGNRKRLLDWVEIAHPQTSSDLPHETFHKALDAYIEHLKRNKGEDHSGWMREQIKQAESLKRLPDLPLSRLTLRKMEEQVAFWAKRPKATSKKKPISALTARNRIKQLKDFWRWLSRNDNYSWRRPEGYDEIRCRVQKIPADQAAKMKAVHIPTYSVEELTTLYKNASPMVRLFMLLGLNCGFSTAEMGSLTTDEVFLNTAHPHFPSTSHDSWILRVRIKSGVYGEWKLWPQTVQGLQWAINRMHRLGGEKYLLISSKGVPMNKNTRTGNKSSRIPNLWNNLLRTVLKENSAFRKLSIKYLRKTAGTMIRSASDGEIAGVFLCHGTPVKSDALADVYTNRPFDKVFKAIDEVGKRLQPMFDAVASPFPA